MVDEKVQFSFSNSCLTTSSSSRSSFVQLNNEELYQELDELLSAFCSDAQQQFCVDQDILLADDLKRMRHTVQQIQSLLPTITSTNNNGLPLQRTLVRVIQEILNCYGEACHKRNMRLMDDLSTNQSIGEWHQLKQQWEHKSKENKRLLLILDDITLLTQSWKQQNKDQNVNDRSYKHMVLLPSLSSLPHRLSSATKRVSSTSKHSKTITTTSETCNKDILTTSTSLFSVPSSSSLSTTEDILTSLLTTFVYPPGAYTVIIDKHNYRQLGLQQGKIGTRQIIFDRHQLSTSDMIDMINRLCDLFASSFATTAQHHLTQIDSQMKKAQPFYMLTQSIKKLSAQVSNATRANIGEEHAKDRYINKETTNDCSSSRTPSPISINATNDTSSSSPLLQHTLANTSAMSILSPFRLTHSSSRLPWTHPILPIPSFAPAPWQIPDLLKPRHPYSPVFFGLIRRRTHMDSSISTPRISNSNSSRYHQSSFLKHSQQYETTVQRTPSVQQARKSGHQTPRTFTNNKYAAHTPAHHNDKHASSATINDSIDNSFSSNSSCSPPIQPRASISTASPLHQHNSISFDKARRSPVSSSTTIKDHSHLPGGYSHNHLSNYSSNDDDDDDDEDDNLMNSRFPVGSNRMAPFTSVSVDKLSFYLGKIAGQFYQDLLVHTRLRYQETQDTLQEMECQMMDLYRQLQLASSRAVMHRAMMIVQELDERHQQYKHQEEYQHSYPPLSPAHDSHTVYIYQQDQDCHANDLVEEDEESSSSSNDTSDSDSYEHSRQHAKIAPSGRWRPICINTYHHQGNSPTSSIVRQDSQLYRKGVSTKTSRK